MLPIKLTNLLARMVNERVLGCDIAKVICNCNLTIHVSVKCVGLSVCWLHVQNQLGFWIFLKAETSPQAREQQQRVVFSNSSSRSKQATQQKANLSVNAKPQERRI
ncbi:hypothetical protein M0802_005537 [Mischocyttarus mexicanus]|nr:hypothetical protein M0802_016887 [Mischocyttarus mexicanus]KAI4499277.1 hypothetical protein M0802_005537 [Mischocyttarus mexicanus]